MKKSIVLGICILVLLVLGGCKVDSTFDLANAIQTGDFESCTSFTGEKWDICISNIAIRLAIDNQDPSYCDKLTANFDKDSCKISAQGIVKCEGLGSSLQQGCFDDKYYNLALREQKIEHCNKILDTFLATKCKDMLLAKVIQ
ncbi:hypothetical protein KY330_02785 [Candidatus Woesearchaeota archaeon]|nr:hypothetical protein [Candidatus Woesearchaeota archaeon]